MGKKTQESRQVYNSMAANYDTSKEGQYTAFHINELVNTVEVSNGDRILDVACGTGTLLKKLKNKKDIEAYGIDISENMIAVAQGKYPDIHFEALPCFPLNFDDASLDVITVCCAFHHFEVPQSFVKECFRVLKQGGRVYIADPNYGPLLRFLANKILVKLMSKGDVKVYSQKELEAFFKKENFSFVNSYRKGKGVFLQAQK